MIAGVSKTGLMNPGFVPGTAARFEATEGTLGGENYRGRGAIAQNQTHLPVHRVATAKG
jgi:hypothetical protein